MGAFDFTIRTKQDLVDAIGTYGFLPFFACSIPGFSLEEHVTRDLWYSHDSDEWKAWEWKGPVIRETGCAYGKFFENKAVFISREWFADFANYRRDGYDFDARYDDGLASRRDKELFELMDANAPILSRDLKRLGNYCKDGRKGFDTIITRLQAQGYVLISDFVYASDKYGRTYGWGIAEYSTPEKFFGPGFRKTVYQRPPEESYERLLAHLRSLFPETEEKVLRKILK
ncbi:MAG: hypothetical protein J5865_01550 [Lachnospiraceae bacterium]|nr:hypothetical protein [Lachnospiraceae bacterium]